MPLVAACQHLLPDVLVGYGGMLPLVLGLVPHVVAFPEVLLVCSLRARALIPCVSVESDTMAVDSSDWHAAGP